MDQYLIIEQVRNKIEALVNECLSGSSKEERKELLTLIKISHLGAGNYFLQYFYNARNQYGTCIDETVKKVLELNNVTYYSYYFEEAKAIQSKLEEYLENKIPKDNDYFNNLPTCLKNTIRDYYHNTPEFLDMKKKIRTFVKKSFSGALTESIEKWYINHDEWSEGE